MWWIAAHKDAIAVWILGLFVGAAIGMIVKLFLLRSSRTKSDEIWDLLGKLSDQTLEPKDREAITRRVDELTAAEKEQHKKDRFVMGLIGVAGILSLGLLIFGQSKSLSDVFPFSLFQNHIEGLLEFVTPAQAASNPDLGAALPYIAMGIMLVLALAFIVALVAVFVLKDIPDNQSRIRAAGDIVKMFGGFFTGLATTLLSAPGGA